MNKDPKRKILFKNFAQVIRIVYICGGVGAALVAFFLFFHILALHQFFNVTFFVEYFAASFYFLEIPGFVPSP